MIKTEKSCGVILVLRREGDEDKFLLLYQNQRVPHWSFPKGHMEEGETSRETAIRELQEEAGITEIEFADLPSILEEYDFETRPTERSFGQEKGKIKHKINEFFIAFTKNDEVTPQEDEILDYKWVTYREALKTFTYEQPKEVLKKVQKYLAK
jgi:8-oxo-dGTP pyrophosphatase MutT (NUDIX family)